jgi:hypothetical protein
MAFRMKTLDIFQKCAILNSIGRGNLMQTAGVASVMGGNSLNKSLTVSSCEPVGRCICTGVTVCTFSTPAGSFFVSGVETGEKIQTKNLTNRR